MHISGLQKLTLLDYPGKTAATVFTPGCDFRCPFCHNSALVLGDGGVRGGREAGADPFPHIDEEEVLAFLDHRLGLLDGICVTGGEPLMQADLADFLARVREKGFSVKLDTNGSFPDRLRDLVGAGLVDYVAMDVKNASERYAETVGVPTLDVAPVLESIEFLLGGDLPFEFRTTVVREFHPAESLQSLALLIAGAPAWYLQGFIDSEDVIAGPGRLHACTPQEMQDLADAVRGIVPTVTVRGV